MPMRLLKLAASLQVCLILLTVAAARPSDRPPGSKSAPPSAPTGILTTRLTPKQLKRWQAIVKLVWAEDAAGTPLHPTLRTLWERVAGGGNAVYIELRRARYNPGLNAGLFKLEKFDPLGRRHVASIQLRLSVIDDAVTKAIALRPSGYIPFTGLSKEERYAEVLGHELAHAVWTFSSLARARQMEEIVARPNRAFLAWRASTNGAQLARQFLPWFARRDALLIELEREADFFEEAVWRELRASQHLRAARPKSVTQATPASLAIHHTRSNKLKPDSDGPATSEPPETNKEKL